MENLNIDTSWIDEYADSADKLPKLSAERREYLITEILYCGEGEYSKNFLDVLTDGSLCRTFRKATHDYAMSQIGF